MSNRRNYRWKIMTVGLAWAVIMAAGCGPRNYANDNDQLRRKNMELERHVEDLQQKLDLKIAQIETMDAQQQNIGKMDAADIPRAVKIKLDRYSDAVDFDDDGCDDGLRLHVKVFDQHGQFIPVAGQLVVQCVVIEPEQQPVILVEKTISSGELKTAYRSGLTGTHYTFEVAFDEKQWPKWVAQATTATVKITLTDANTGARLATEQAVGLNF